MQGLILPLFKVTIKNRYYEYSTTTMHCTKYKQAINDQLIVGNLFYFMSIGNSQTEILRRIYDLQTYLYLFQILWIFYNQ